jgi:hypothetical protein
MIAHRTLEIFAVKNIIHFVDVPHEKFMAVLMQVALEYLILLLRETHHFLYVSYAGLLLVSHDGLEELRC